MFGGPSVVGGATFDDAPTIEPGSYTSDIVNGETQVFLVDVGWGQRLDATVSWPELPTDAERSGSAHLDVYGPGHREASQIVGSKQTLLGTFFDQLNASSYPVRYLNRSGVNELPGSALPGAYAVVVSTVPDEDASRAPMEYALDIGVAGRVEGEPRYSEDLATEVPASGTEGTDPDSETEGTEGTEPEAGTESEGSETGTDGEDPDTGDTASSSAGSDDGLDPLVPVGLGTAGVLAIGGAVLLAVRRRRLG